MAYGTLAVDTLNSSTGVLATQNGMTGIAKAWVLFDATTSGPTIRNSFNVSSVTKQATGQFQITITTAMTSTNYCVTGSVVNGTTPSVNGAAWLGGSDYSGATAGSQTTTTFYFGTWASPASATNYPYTQVIVHGS